MNNNIKKILKILIETKTDSQNELKLIKKILDYLKHHNFEYSIIDTKEKNRSSLIIDLNIEKKETIYFIGHLDTVKAGNKRNWKSDPFILEEDDEYFYGRGTSDMKSGIAIMVNLIDDLLSKKINSKYRLKFIFTADEEKNGKGILTVNKFETFDDCKLIIVPEPTNLKIGRREKGALWINYNIFGKTAHASSPQNGKNSIEEAYKLYRNVKEKFESLNTSNHINTVTLTEITSGIQPNVIPDLCNFTLDVRLSNLLTEDAFNILKIIEKDCISQGVNIEKKILNRRETLIGNLDRSNVLKLERIFNEVNENYEEIEISYYTDLSQINYINKKNYIILGPGELKIAHQPNEYVKKENILKCIEIYKKIIKGVLKNEKV